MKIKVYLGVSETKGYRTFDLYELGYNEDDWNILTDEEKEKAVQDEVNNLNDQPYWLIDSFTEDID